MSLRDLASKGLAGFDPKTDEIVSASGLPAGDYLTSVTAIEHRAFDSGWDCFGVSFQVMEGEHEGQTENVNISFAEKSKSGKAIPDFILDRNIKFAAKLGSFLGVDVTDEDFDFDNETDIHEHLGQKLHGHEGLLTTLKVTVRPNKKDPSNPYTSYDLEEAEQPEELELDDSDLPSNMNPNSDAPLPSENDDPFANSSQDNTIPDDQLPFD
ncbi:hypothetical protein AYR62_15805 (plasmid) [Secundilactobacillus paracollinoides]|uniref:hypothetical protein n=1 Tax=Secundilactobacillus paracollinoides TaxID=240427 RepID=UPI00081A99E0|nr:hypothetical protein [Secundilactobacillus paracollinoides]ANZ65549.1 hypothetical protein AYR62_15805 [Secundilactobacillus paracollinoides]